MFLILLYTTTDYPNSYVDINVILPAIRLNTALSCRWSDRKIINVGLIYEFMSKAYLLVICLLAASFTGCLGSDKPEDESPTTEDDTIEPVGT